MSDIMVDTFPMEALEETMPFYPNYNGYLEKEADGTCIEMYSLRRIFEYEQMTDKELWVQCDKCKVDGHVKQYVFPSLVIPKDSNRLGKAQLIIIGEAPGREEDENGFGYVGDSGQFLFGMLTQMWKDELPVVMLGNSVMCWPKDNKTPTVSWYKNCGGKFWPRILCDKSLIDDKAMIVVTGAVPYKMLYACADGQPTCSNITAVHGNPCELTFTYGDVTRTFPVFPTYHPAMALRSPDKIPMIIEDFEKMYTAYNRYINLEEGQSLIDGRDENTVDLDKDMISKVYKKMLRPADIDQIMQELEEQYAEYEDKTVCYDVETKYLNTADPTNFIRLAGFGTIKKHTYQFMDNAVGGVAILFKRLRDAGFKVCGHNLWFDMMMSWKERLFECVDDLPEIRDTRIMHKLIDENSVVNKLKLLCMKYFGVPDWSQPLNQFEDADGNVDWTKIPEDDLLKYHRGDLYYNVKLYYLFAEKCASEEVSGHWVIDYVDFKHRLHKELMQTSINGFVVDNNVLGNLITEYSNKRTEVIEWFKQPLFQRVVASINQMDKEMKDAVKGSLCTFPLVEEYNPDKDVFNPNSTMHLGALLAVVLDDAAKTSLIKSLGSKGRTKAGKISLSEGNLEKICEILVEDTNLLGRKTNRFEHLVEGIKKVLECRAVTKVYGTYLDGMCDMMWSDTSVRCQWNVDGAATGRLSAARPNLQQIPRGDTAKGIKQMFVPRYEGWTLMQFDLSQAELRGLGSFTHDKTLKKAFDDGLDLHKFTAAGIFHVPIEQVVKSQRQLAKTINFCITYQGSAPTVAAQAGVPLPEAEAAVKKWHEFYSSVQPWMDERGREVEERGYVTGLWGLKRRLPISMANEADGADLKRQGGNCVDAETEILTAEGWKRYDELHIGDLIVSFNMDTQKLERDVVKAVNIFNDGPYSCIEFSHPSLSAVTTPNHRWPVYDSSTVQKYHFVTTQDMSRKGQHRILRCADGMTSLSESLSYPITDTLLKLMGWLLTDASITNSKIVIYQSLTANGEKVNRIEELLQESGLSYTKTTRQRYLADSNKSYKEACFYIHKSAFTQWFKSCLTKDGALSNEVIFALSEHQAHCIIHEMILGDGYFSFRKDSFCCSNKAKADAFQALCTQAGIATSTHKRHAGRKAVGNIPNKSGYIETKNTYYVINLLRRDKAHIYEHHRKLKQVPLVWCPTTGLEHGLHDGTELYTLQRIAPFRTMLVTSTAS